MSTWRTIAYETYIHKKPRQDKKVRAFLFCIVDAAIGDTETW